MELVNMSQNGNSSLNRNEIAPSGDVTFFSATINESKKKSGASIKYFHATCADQQEPKFLYELLTNEWQNKCPNILVSFIGEKDVRYVTGTRFQNTLINVTKNTDIWMVTHGRHVGVAKYVGKAVHAQNVVKHNAIVALGVAKWIDFESHLEQNEKGLMYKYGSNGGKLDANHTHLFLVDADKENEVRLKLENYIDEKISSKGKCQVKVLFNGGIKSLKVVYNALSEGTPVVVFGDTGGWASILATICTKRHTDITDELISKLMLEYGSLPEFDASNSESPAYERRKPISHLTNMARECVKHRKLITVTNVEPSVSSIDLDVAMLQALVGANSNKIPEMAVTLLKPAMAWERHGIAQNRILTDGTAAVLKKKPELSELFKQALEDDKPAFVDLFLDFGMLLQQDFKYNDLVKIYNDFRSDLIFYEIFEINNRHVIYDVERFLQLLIGHSTEMSYKSLENGDGSFSNHQEIMFELFQLCILLDRQDTGLVLWSELVEGKLLAAVIAIRMLQKIAETTADKTKKSSLENHAELYKCKALGILTNCHKDNPRLTNVLLTQSQERWGTKSIMQIAADANDMEFISHSAVQQVLSEIWMGDVVDDSTISIMGLKFVICGIFFFLIPLFIKFKPRKTNLIVEDNQVNMHDPLLDSERSLQAQENEETFYRRVFRKCGSYYTAPVVKFWMSIISYLAFLCFFAYILLFNLRGYTTHGISISEYVLLVWVIIHGLDELCEVTKHLVECNCKIFKTKARVWFSSFWNKLDLLAIILFVIGFIIRFFDVDVGRLFLSFSFMVYCIRVLNVFSAYKELGPKLIMVGKMVQDLVFFLFLLFVFMVAYGVASQSLLYPNDGKRPLLAIKSVFSKPYWQIYGELFLEDSDTNQTSCTFNETLASADFPRCPEQEVVVQFLSAVYLLLANVLLLNLLIAMFSYTFDKLVDNTDMIWKCQRYWLVDEYYSRADIVSPLSFLAHIWHFLNYCRQCISGKKRKNETEFAKTHNEINKDEILSWEQSHTEAYIASLQSDDGEAVSNKLQGINKSLVILTSSVNSMSELLSGQKAITRKLHQTNQSQEWIITALKNQGFKPERFSSPVHVKARSGKYPRSDVIRTTLEDHVVPWNVAHPDYDPNEYTSTSVIGPPAPNWADRDVESENPQIITFNQFDEDSNVDRTSYTGYYEVVDGLPRNPMGRTGIVGRGRLGRYGPNHAVDAAVTRWKRNDANNHIIIHPQSGKPILEFIAIQRQTTMEWSIPGRMVRPGGYILDTLKECFFTEVRITGDDAARDRIDNFFSSGGVEVYRGYSDDHRNTDNSWVETICMNFHDKLGIFKDIECFAGKSVASVAWQDIDDSLKLFASHGRCIKEVAKLHKAHWSSRKRKS